MNAHPARGNRTQRRLQRWARWTVLSVVIAAPWLYGAHDPWALLLACLGLHLGVALWLASLVADPDVEVRAPAALAALVALGVYYALCCLPLPEPIARPLAGRSVALSAAAQAALRDDAAGVASPAAPSATLFTIAVAGGAARRSLLLFSACAGAFLVLGNTVRRAAHLRHAALAISLGALVLVVEALAQKLSGTRLIYWFYEPRYGGGSIFGPFSNRNHYAAHINMALGIIAGLALCERLRSRQAAGRGERRRTPRRRPSVGGLSLLLGLGAVLACASVCVSLSRGGFACLALAGGVGLLAAYRQGYLARLPVPALLAGLLLVVAFVAWLGWQPMWERLETLAQVARDPLADTRAVAFLDTLRLWRSAPLLGCGLGCFQYAFPAFQSPEIQVGRFLHAHNDIAQLLAETGVVGGILALLAAGAWLRYVVTHYRSTTEAGRRFITGAAVGVMAIVLHSALDYSLHKPANAILLAALCGLITAAAQLPLHPSVAGADPAADREGA